jgi:hypothetical protein
MLTFLLVTPRWTDPADASVAAPMTASTAVIAKSFLKTCLETCLPRRIAAPLRTSRSTRPQASHGPFWVTVDELIAANCAMAPVFMAPS